MLQGGTDLKPNDDVYPSWGHWGSEVKYLPASFHCKDGFQEVDKALRVPLPEETYHHLERFALVVGLALRDVTTAVVHEDAELVPDWIKNSTLREKHINRLLKCCPPTIVEKPVVQSAV
jgi:hypothetical protein